MSLQTPPPSARVQEAICLDDEISPQLRRSKRQSVDRSKNLLFDAKYHPLDEYTRPANAAKRRRFHNISVSDESDEDEDESQTSDENSRSRKGRDESEEYVPPGAKKNKRDNRHEMNFTRNSSRAIALQPLDYDINVHPQDDDLISSGIVMRTPNGKISEDVPVYSDSNSDSDESVVDNIQYNRDNRSLGTPEPTAEDEVIFLENSTPGSGVVQDTTWPAVVDQLKSSPNARGRWYAARLCASPSIQPASRPVSAGSTFPTGFDLALEVTEPQQQTQSLS